MSSQSGSICGDRERNKGSIEELMLVNVRALLFHKYFKYFIYHKESGHSEKQVSQ